VEIFAKIENSAVVKKSVAIFLGDASWKSTKNFLFLFVFLAYEVGCAESHKHSGAAAERCASVSL